VTARGRLRFSAVVCALLAASGFAAESPDVADAAMHQDRARVRALLQQKAGANVPQADGTTALMWAAHWGDAETASLLLAAGANPSAANRDGATPLFLASENGNAAMIAKLLDAGADANAPVLPHGETALMMAARSGHADAVQLLLDRGANVNAAETLRGTTALMWAAEQGHADVVKLLIAHGAEIEAKSKLFPTLRRRGLGFAPVTTGSTRLPGDTPVKGGLTALIFAAREGSLDTVRG
jgi:ankyrin repeat protein